MYKKKTKGREPAKLEATKKLFIQITAAVLQCRGLPMASCLHWGHCGRRGTYAQPALAYTRGAPFPMSTGGARAPPLVAASRYAGPQEGLKIQVGYNLQQSAPLVEIGLTDRLKSGEGGTMDPPAPTALRYVWSLCSALGSCAAVVCLAAVACDVAQTNNQFQMALNSSFKIGDSPMLFDGIFLWK